MKKRLLSLAILLLTCIFLIHSFWPDPTQYITSEQRVEHMVVFQNQSGRNIGLCTATAIGPHAILTAEHCDPRDANYPRVLIDLSTRVYHILGAVADNRDHAIMILDGPAFTTYLPLDKFLNVKPARPGEHLYLYGDGDGHYPARRLDGVVDIEVQRGDPSEVDRSQGMFYSTIPAVPGDSGSAVFGEDGRVVGLTTYHLDVDGKPEMAGFSLGFSEQTLRFAATFTPEASLPQHVGNSPLE